MQSQVVYPVQYIFIALFLLQINFSTAAIRTTNQNNNEQDYQDHNQLSQRLANLSKNHPSLANLQSLTKTDGSKDIWLLTIGKGDIANKPALAVVGGVEGDHLLGSELAVQFAEKLLNDPAFESERDLLNEISFYIFPDMSPDAREQYFMPIRYERRGNARPTNLDRDGKVGEDPYDDLNGDGLITMMRIKDPTGKWMRHPDDERIMVRARPEKGEKGNYLLFTEGLDQDKDGQFNEDGEEGVFFNRNFTFNYPVFTTGTGAHAVSEKESRAIADFLFQAKNVFAVITFGPANNLTKPLTYNDKDANTKIFTGWKEHDIKINQQLSNLYKTHVGKQAPKAEPGQAGDFFQWAYFHYGRFSFSTQGWSLPETENDESDTPASQELNLIRWAEDHDVSDIFVPWQSIDHPDFPGKEVEVGGIAPFVMKNPPYTMVDSIALKHASFILEMAALRPKIDLVNIETEKLGTNLHRITAEVMNTGSFPTASQSGEVIRWVQKTVLRINLNESQNLVSGKPVEVLGAIRGHSALKRSWLIRGKGSLNIRVGSEASGFREVQISL